MSAAIAPREDPGKWASAALAAMVHGLLAMFLFYGIRWQTHAPEVFEVELVRAPALVAPASPPQPVVEPAPPPVAKPEPKPEPRPIAPPPKPAIAIKEKEKPKPKEAPRPTPADNKQQKDELKREDARIEASKADQELKQVKEARAAAARSSAQSAWSDQINAKIKRKIVRPPNLSGNPEAIFEVNLLPDGSLVGEPRLIKSTNNALLDAAIERAIIAADPLPKPADPSVFQRTLRLKFRPLEE